MTMQRSGHKTRCWAGADIRTIRQLAIWMWVNGVASSCQQVNVDPNEKADLMAGFSVGATAASATGVVGGTGFEPVTPTMSRLGKINKNND